MDKKNPHNKIIFGLKLKQLRLEKGFSFSDLAKKTGMSVSYLNEIEKGKKFPKADKIKTLAETLEVSKADLTSLELTRNLAPLGELLRSNFLNELPLDLFGIELSKVVEIIANSPLRVGAFISTLVELARNYALGEEHFYHGAMRSYQEMHFNYFEEIEEAVDRFCKASKVPANEIANVDILSIILQKKYKYKIKADGLKDYPELSRLRSVYLVKKKTLLLNGQLTDIQKAFQLAKELGFNYLGLKNRAPTSSLLKVVSFDQVLNHFKGNYFASALLINRQSFIIDLNNFFGKEKWDGEAFLSLLKKYNASPEMLFQRLTNVIPSFFGIRKLFFLRFVHDTEKDRFSLDKELHLQRQHHPHSNGLQEHYCRRWLSLSLLKDLNKLQQQGIYTGTLVGAQRSRYFGTNEEYLCLTLARPAHPNAHTNISVTIGLEIDEMVQQKIKFLDDPAILMREVNTTCQRCAIQDCKERAVPATIIQRKEERKKIEQALKKLMDE